MAIHADVEGRNPGVPAFFSREVTVRALNLEIAGVELVRVGNWLDRLVPLVVTGKTDCGHQGDQADGEGCR
jgi:hypothetical protein